MDSKGQTIHMDLLASCKTGRQLSIVAWSIWCPAIRSASPLYWFDALNGQHAKHPLASELRIEVVLAGGMTRGTITVDGYPKDQATFNRVSGYVEQVPPQS